MIGQTVGHYRITERLGQGGMGVVYKAEDTKLKRPVALKLLPAELSREPQALARLEREAQAASALNHPHICTIYEVGEAGGQAYIAMEYVQGQTLRAQVPPDGLAVETVLRYGTQIADALAHAHDRGVVHRDLKTANVMITPEGQSKVLDFGLAKRMPEGDLAEATRSMASMSGQGVIAGTLPYMAPELFRGEPADARSDLWALGVMLHEMTTGVMPFQGRSGFELTSAILRDPPPPLPAHVPAGLRGAIGRLLAKEPGLRYRNAGEARAALEAVGQGVSQSRPEAGSQARLLAPRKGWLVAAGALVAALAAVVWWISARSPTTPRQGVELVRVTADEGLTAFPALSRDGKLLAYASDRSGDGNLDIWVQQTGSGGAPLRLTRDEADESEPTFSPDGTRIAFRSERGGGGIYVIPTLGGEPQRLVDHGRSPRFSPDGQWIAYWTGDAGVSSSNRLYVVASGGGDPQRLASDFFSAYFPLWSPDGRHLLFLGARDTKAPLAERYDWWVMPLDGGAPVSTGAGALLRQHSVGGFRCPGPGDWFGDSVFFTAGLRGANTLGAEVETNLWQLRIAPGNWRVHGAPERLTFGTGMEAQPSVGAGPNQGRRLVLADMAGNPDVWSLLIDANQGRVLGEMRRLTSNIAADNYPTVSADGKKISFSSDRFKPADIYVKDLETGKETALTSTPMAEYGSFFSPDGARVAGFALELPPARGVFFYVVSAAGGPVKKVCEGCDGQFTDWSLDGKKFIVRKRGAGGLEYLVLWDLETRQESPFLQHSKYSVTVAKLSPDGRWAAFQTVIDQMRRQIFVAPVRDGAPPGETSWIPITDGSSGDLNAVWSPDGNLLYFYSLRDSFRCFWAQRLEPASKRPVGAAFAVQHFHQTRRSLMPVVEVAAIGLSVARDKLVFSMAERTGNIWMTELAVPR